LEGHLSQEALPARRRVVALGASNLTRGFPAVVANARAAWGEDVEVLAALGHGRSYGSQSLFLGRRLPGILESGLWRQLACLPAAPTRGLITDVGNDILYGFPAERIVAWVGEAADRLRRFTDDVVLTDLPLASIRRLSPAGFLLFRSVLVPRCRLSLPQVAAAAERVNGGLLELATARGLRLQHLREEWYGIDPIHIRPRLWWLAWREILLGDVRGATIGRASRREGVRLYFMRPERQWLFGREQLNPQRGAPLHKGGKVWLY
jgi:hypothetical protein